MQEDDLLGNEEVEDEQCFTEFNYIPLDLFVYDIDDVVKETYSRLVIPRDKCGQQAVKILESNSAFAKKIIPPCVFLVHYTLFLPDQVAECKKYKLETGKIWENFLFIFNCDQKVPLNVRNSFLDIFPYFIAQAIQIVYRIISHNPDAERHDNLLSICSIVLTLFCTPSRFPSIISDKIYTYLNESMRSEPAKPQSAEVVDDVIKKVRLPIEDVNSLPETEHRIRPKSYKFNMSSISPLLSASTNRTLVPFENATNIVVQYPKNGEEDWTVNLPPLLPPIESSTTNAQTGRDLNDRSYDPSREPRSLLHRSRRPDICRKVEELKETLSVNEETNIQKLNKIKKDMDNLKTRLNSSDHHIKNKFIHDLRALQINRKRNETPEIPEIEKPQEKSAPAINRLLFQKSSSTLDEYRVKYLESKEEVKKWFQVLRESHDNCITNQINTHIPSKKMLFASTANGPFPAIEKHILAPIREFSEFEKKKAREDFEKKQAIKQKPDFEEREKHRIDKDMKEKETTRMERDEKEKSYPKKFDAIVPPLLKIVQ